MTPARRSFAILALAAAATVATLLLTRLPAPPPLPPTDEPDPSGISLQMRHASSRILAGTNETHLAVTVTAPRGDTTRPDLDLAIVIDRSTSMHSGKLEQAKAAAQQLVSMLGERDRFSIVVYGTEVHVAFPMAPATAEGKRVASAAIDAILMEGSTNIGAALETARAQVLGMSRRSGVSRIILLSDGKATIGMVHPDALAQLAESTAREGISITTVGIGLDFDEQMMTRIAVAGRGNYYFAESGEMLAQMFDDELGRLGDTVATGAELMLQPAAGVEVIEAYGYPIVPVRFGLVSVPIADLRAGETRKVVFRVRVTATAAGTIDLASARLAFTDLGSGQTRTLGASARAEVTRDNAQVVAGYDREAMQHIVRARTAAGLEEATARWENGDYAGAQQVIDRSAREATDVARFVNAPELDAEVGRVSAKARDNFAKEPKGAGSARAKMTSKDNRNDAYKLAH